MKKYLKLSYNGLFFFALLILLTLNVFISYSENPLLLDLSKTLFIPFFLIMYFIKNKTLSLTFISFLVFSFFGDCSALFFAYDSVTNTSNIMYLLSYISLIVMSISKFKLADIDKVVGLYLLMILLINGYFLLTICNILSALITDGTEMILFGAKSMTLVFLVFISFAVYLGKQTKTSILFLVMAICFAFSDILNYITHYYIYDWSILMIDRLLHITGVFFAFKYSIEASKIPKEKRIEKELTEEIFSGGNILV